MKHNRSAIISKLEAAEKMDKLLTKSKLTQEDTLKYGKMINKRIWKKHRAGKKAEMQMKRIITPKTAREHIEEEFRKSPAFRKAYDEELTRRIT